MTRTESLLASALLVLAACDAAVAPPPRPASVSPAAGFASGGAPVEIRGDAFFLEPVQQLDDERSQVRGRYRVWIGDRELEAVEWISETRLRARCAAGLPVGRHDVAVEGPFGRGVLPAGYEVLPGAAAALAVSIDVPPLATIGQELTVSLGVESTGGGAAAAVMPQLEVSGPGAVELVAAPAGGLELGAGERRVLSWTYRATGAGAVVFTASASGSDPRTGAVVSSSPVSATLLVERPAALAALARADRTSAAVGQTFAVTLEVTNTGGTDARGVLATALPLDFTWLQSEPPPAQDIAAGETASFTWTFLAIGAGSGAFAFDAAGTDVISGAVVAAARAATAPVRVEVPAALGAYAIASPARVSTGQTVTVSFHVENYGAVPADVLPSLAVLGTATLAATGAPAAQRVEAGGRNTFVWTFRATAPGTASFMARVEGVDTIGLPVSATASSGSVLVQSAAALSATVAAAQAASVGQTVQVALVVTNLGAASADVVPALAISGPGTLFVASAPLAERLSGGEVATFVWTLLASGAGDATLLASVGGADVNSGEPLSASAGASLRVETAARLEAELVASPDPVNEGQELLVRMRVLNAGEATALDVAPGPLARSGGGAAAAVSGPMPATASLAGGQAVWFEWRYTATAAGPLGLAGAAAGKDRNSGATVTAASAAAAPVRVQRPATLAVRFVSPPARVNTGQVFEAELEITNDGESSATSVAADLSMWPSATPGPAPAAVTVAGGASARVKRSFASAALGTATLTGAVAGTDATDGKSVSASAGVPVVVERPAALSAVLTLPASIEPGEFPVTMRVSNAGDAAAVGVLPGALSLAPDGTAAVTLVAGPSQAVTLTRGASTDFVWTYRAASEGTLQLSGEVSGVDGNDGAVRSASAVSDVALVRQVAQVVAVDPFLDGTRFAFVAAQGGKLYLGPGKYGSELVRMQVDGTGPQSLALSFARDAVGGNQSTNTARPSGGYASIGHTDCSTNSFSNACGPDNENGRGLLTSVTMGGEEWLVVGGARLGGDLDYVYMARGDLSAASTASFSYVDLSAVLGGNTRGFSAAMGHGDRLYLGFPDNGGNRPYGLALLTPPPSPGLDALPSAHVLDLDFAEGFKKALGSFASVAMVDAIAELNGRLYFFNNVGCIVSTVSAPATKDDFAGCSPLTSAAYDHKGSIEPTRQHDLEPRDRAWPQVAVWNGRLYAIRNTYTGPQLWRCDPALGADPGRCEPADWSVVADDGTYRSRFGKAGATAATLLVATPKHLYVGLDDESGIHVFRTDVEQPSATSEFRGRDGCAAGTAGCEGLGGDGFDDPDDFDDPVLTRIFDAKAVTGAGGSTSLVLTAGNGAAPVHVIRISE